MTKVKSKIPNKKRANIIKLTDNKSKPQKKVNKPTSKEESKAEEVISNTN